eukprot:m.336286 g.336286  ORF g.336286 m.336286 type:complete len:821 (+) comp19795_c1_seq2:5475-7937(+)
MGVNVNVRAWSWLLCGFCSAAQWQFQISSAVAFAGSICRCRLRTGCGCDCSRVLARGCCVVAWLWTPRAMLRATLPSAPSPEVGVLTEVLPWAVVVEPLAPSDCLVASGVAKDDVARCRSCRAFINPLASVYRSGDWVWECALCSSSNSLPPRYTAAGSTRNRRWSAPEMNSACVEFELPQSPSDRPAPLREQPLAIVVVDLGQRDFANTVAAARAFVEALPDEWLVSLLTFAQHVDVYDFGAPTTTTTRRVELPSDATPCNQTLKSLVPLRRLFAKMGSRRAQVLAALDALTPVPARSGLGAVMHLVIQGMDELADDFERAHGGIRVTLFVSQVPTWGLGACTNRYREENTGGAQTPATDAIVLEGLDSHFSESDASALMVPQAEFFKIQGQAAVDAGIVVDVVAVGDADSFCDLATLRFLATCTGGVVMRLDTAKDSRVLRDKQAQDLARRRYAFDCLCMARLSRDIAVESVLGHVGESVLHPGAWASAGWAAGHAFCFELARNRSGLFTAFRVLFGEPTVRHVVQVVFSFTAVGVHGDRRLKRFLRIHTIEFPVVKDTLSVLKSVDPEACMYVVSQKVARTALDAGIGDARRLVHGWFLELLKQYRSTSKRTEEDVWFRYHPNLQQLQRLAFGLLAGVWLDSATLHPDERACLTHAHSRWSCQALSCLTYPLLYAFPAGEQGDGVDDEYAAVTHPLSLKEITQRDEVPIVFLLDAGSRLIIAYNALAEKVAESPSPMWMPHADAIARREGGILVQEIVSKSPGQWDPLHAHMLDDPGQELRRAPSLVSEPLHIPVDGLADWLGTLQTALQPPPSADD